VAIVAWPSLPSFTSTFHMHQNPGYPVSYAKHDQWQFLSPIGDNTPPIDVVSSTLAPPGGRSVASWNGGDCAENRLWLISGMGFGATRTNLVPPVSVTSLSTSEILNRTGPAGTIYSSRGIGQFRVTLVKAAGESYFFCDASQEIEVWGHRVIVSPWMPTGSLTVSDAPVVLSAAVGSELVTVDSIVRCSVEPIDSARGMHLPKLTTRHHIATNERVLVEVPPFAKFVRLYLTNPIETDLDFIEWRWLYGADEATAPSTLMPWPTDQFTTGGGETFSVSTDYMLVPDATHLRTDANADADRTLLCVWELQV
jgi:hypothetical protein